MLGDDPDPSVKTARVGFGEVSDTHARGLSIVHRDSGLDMRENEQQGI